MRQNNLHKTLIRIAVLSSPILALYGVTPLYSIGIAPIESVLKVFIFLLTLAIVFWVINIYIVHKTEGYPPWCRYVISYISIIVLQSIFFIIAPRPPIPVVSGKIFFIYPLLLIIAINTIINIICNSAILAKKKQSAELEVELLRAINLETQKRALSQQLQPHFLFNSLSILKSLIRYNPDEAEDYTIKLSDFLRYAVDAHSIHLVTVDEELKFTNDYIELQKVRFQNALNLSIEIPEDVYSLKIPTYALQGLVENAIKHNSFTEKKPLHVEIRYHERSISVTNNKMPLKIENTGRTGLKNLDDRYKIITGEGIVINDAPDIFQVTIKLIPE